MTVRRPAPAVFAVVLAVGALAATAAAENIDGIVGVWETAPTDKGYAHIEITRDGDDYNGTIVWLDEPLYPADDEMAGQPKIDRMNPDPALRERPIIGLQIVHGLRWAGDDRWDGGAIYDPETGKTYKSKAALADGGATLKLRGFIGISLLGRTSQWKRIR